MTRARRRKYAQRAKQGAFLLIASVPVAFAMWVCGL